MPSEHAELGFGGSTATRTLNCPGWRHEAVKLPEEMLNRTSPAAEVGTRLHAEIEGCLAKGTEPSSPKVERALSLFDDLLDRYGVPDDPSLIITEQRVALGDVPGAWGSCDIVVDHAPLIVLDWKFGDGVLVFAHENDQGQFYGKAAIDTLFEPGTFSPDDVVVIAIIQPHGREGVDELTTWETTVGDLQAWEQRFKQALAQGHLAPGDWCKFCPAKVTCPALNERALTAVETDIPSLQPEAIAESLDIADQLEEWIKTLREFAHGQMEAGVEIPRWKRVLKRATKRWTDEAAVFEWLKKKRVPVTEAAPRKLLTPAQMIALLKKTDVELDGGLVDESSSGTTLAPESDKRPAVQPTGPTAAKIFAEQLQQQETRFKT